MSKHYRKNEVHSFQIFVFVSWSQKRKRSCWTCHSCLLFSPEMGLKPNTKRVKNSLSGVCLDRGRSWSRLPQSSRVWSAVRCDQNKFVMRLHAKFWFLNDTMWEKLGVKMDQKMSYFLCVCVLLIRQSHLLKAFMIWRTPKHVIAVRFDCNQARRSNVLYHLNFTVREFCVVN